MYSRRTDLALDVAKKYIGTFYSWGGDDPHGFDCSGFVIEVLKSVGLLPRKFDTTAHGLHQRFKAHRTLDPTEGCLLFWGLGGNIIHVEMVLAKIGEQIYTIGASGGTSKTKTKDDAIRDNAFIKVRPARNGWTKCVNPFWSLTHG